MAIQQSSDWILYEIKLNFSKFDSSSDENNDENNDENQTIKESASTEGTVNTIEIIYHLTLDSVFANYRQRCAQLILEGLLIWLNEEAKLQNLLVMVT